MRWSRTSPHAGRDRLEHSAAVATWLPKNASDRRGARPRVSLRSVRAGRACEAGSHGPGPAMAMAEAAVRAGYGRLPGRQARASVPGWPSFFATTRAFSAAARTRRCKLKPVIAQVPLPAPPMSPAAGPPALWRVPEITTPAGAGRSPRDRSGPPGMAGRLPGPRAHGSPGSASPLSLSLGHESLGIAPADRIAQASAEARSSAGCSTRSSRRFPPHALRTAFAPAGRSRRSSPHTPAATSCSRWISATSSPRSRPPGWWRSSSRRAIPKTWPGCWPGYAPTRCPSP